MPSKKKSKKIPDKGSDETLTKGTSSLNSSITEEDFCRLTVEPSPSGRKRSFKKLSIENSAIIPINDDCSELTEEKETKNTLDISRDKSSTAAEEEKEMSIVQSMTFDQMQEHVSRCLQLSTENLRKVCKVLAFLL